MKTLVCENEVLIDVLENNGFELSRGEDGTIRISDSDAERMPSFVEGLTIATEVSYSILANE